MKLSSLQTNVISILAVLTGSITTIYLKRCKRKYEEEIAKMQALREAERKGRIKAEILLRTAIKNEEEKRMAASSAFYNSERQEDRSSKSNGESSQNDMLLKCVGEVVSPFLKRMGTPRQGALAPHARGYIQMHYSVAPMETLEGIESYSHAWVLFCFHANTDCQSLSVKTKVRPPRAGGTKVGCMATRSPHRPNPIGLSLVKVLGIDLKKKRLYISALDLVNGTPVYDIKPCVPWDIPGHFDGHSIHVPDWVSQEDSLSSVEFSSEAEEKLEKLVNQNVLEPLYQPNEDGFQNAKKAIEEVLAQDPRASKKRGKVDDNKNEPYKVTFGAIQIHFFVSEKRKLDVVNVTRMQLEECSYVDGVPLATDGTLS